MENSPLFYEFYDDLFADKDYMAEVQFLLDLASIKERGQRILEIGAGTGNHTFCLARLDYDVVGIDIDRQMVSMAEQKRKKSSPPFSKRIQFIHGRIEGLKYDDFDLAIAMFNVVNYLASLAELQSFMQAVAERLKPEAPFVFDGWNGIAAILDPPKHETRQIETETHRIHIHLRSQTDTMALHTDLTYDLKVTDKITQAQQTGSYVTRHTLWAPKIICDVAQSAGFTVESIYPLMTKARVAKEDDWKILFLCRKKP